MKQNFSIITTEVGSWEGRKNRVNTKWHYHIYKPVLLYIQYKMAENEANIRLVMCKLTIMEGDM